MTDTTASAGTPLDTITPITITATELRKSPGEFLDRVFYRGERFVVERAGKPMAVIGPVNDMEAYESGVREMKKGTPSLHL